MRRALDAGRVARRADSAPTRGSAACCSTTTAATVAEGWHRGAGTPHAEADALRQAGAAARGTTAVVTLEPCNHTGRTGPCARALVDAGVRRVVYAQPDPNPVAAGGAATLRAAGVEVEGGLLERRGSRASTGSGRSRWTTAARS